MDIGEAADEFFTWGTYQQVDCLAALDTRTAAGILQRMDPDRRREVVSMMEPYVAANIVQVGKAGSALCLLSLHRLLIALTTREG